LFYEVVLQEKSIKLCVGDRIIDSPDFRNELERFAIDPGTLREITANPLLYAFGFANIN
jgi:hypothetical protein